MIVIRTHNVRYKKKQFPYNHDEAITYKSKSSMFQNTVIGNVAININRGRCGLGWQ